MNAEIEYAMSEEEVAEALGIHRSRVGQLQRSALRKLKKYFEEQGIEWRDITTEEE
jgi:DNA-directed RNA polymerase sigma subunit (sigma70/sigma32)